MNINDLNDICLFIIEIRKYLTELDKLRSAPVCKNGHIIYSDVQKSIINFKKISLRLILSTIRNLVKNILLNLPQILYENRW